MSQEGHRVEHERGEGSGVEESVGCGDSVTGSAGRGGMSAKRDSGNESHECDSAMSNESAGALANNGERRVLQPGRSTERSDTGSETTALASVSSESPKASGNAESTDNRTREAKVSEVLPNEVSGGGGSVLANTSTAHMKGAEGSSENIYGSQTAQYIVEKDGVVGDQRAGTGGDDSDLSLKQVQRITESVDILQQIAAQETNESGEIGDGNVSKSASSDALNNDNGHPLTERLISQQHSEAKGGLHEDAYTITDEEAVCELDDDENIDNPAYIPKSGRYYMHDSRNADEERIHEPSRSRADGKWKHDRYDERSQRPKTRRELVSKYGFDIRDQNTEEGVRMSRTHTSAASTKHDSRGRGDHRPIRDDQRGEENRSIRTAHNNTSRLPAQHNSRGTAAGPPGQYAQHMSRVVRPSSHGSINTDDVGRIDGDKTYLRDEGGRNRTGGGRGNRAVQQHPARTQLGGGGGGGGGGGKRYSTQRLASNYADQGSLSLSAIANNWHSNFQQPQQTAMHVVQPRAVQHQPALPASRATHVPPPTAMHAAPNFPLPPSDIVYFDPQQQLVRKQIPPPPRAKKRLEIVPPTHSSVDNDDTIRK